VKTKSSWSEESGCICSACRDQQAALQTLDDFRTGHGLRSLNAASHGVEHIVPLCGMHADFRSNGRQRVQW
jgi:hypothetical protein